MPTPIVELTPEMATRLARDLLTVITDPDSVDYVAGFAAMFGDPS